MEKTFYIIDDHEMLRVGTASFITQNSNWISLGGAKSIDSALMDLENLRQKDLLPAVIICDLNFYGDNSGFNYIEKIRSLYPDVKIIVYSMFYAAGMVQGALQSGACGYVSKNASSKEILMCMEKALVGEVFIEEDLQINLIKYNKLTDALTKREKEVMELLLRRLSNDQISEKLGIKKRAVDNYVSLIYEKTGVNDRTSLIEKYGQ